LRAGGGPVPGGERKRADTLTRARVGGHRSVGHGDGAGAASRDGVELSGFSLACWPPTFTLPSCEIGCLN